MLETAYFDLIIVFLFYGAASIFNWVGYAKNIPVIQMASLGAVLFAIIPFMDLVGDEGQAAYGAFILLFVLVNSVMFIMGMVKYRQG